MVSFTTSIFASAAALAGVASAFPAPVPQQATPSSVAPYSVSTGTAPSLNLEAQTFYSFPGETYAYNQAVLANGSIVVTTLTNGTVWLVEPSDGTATEVFDFKTVGKNANNGITEVSDGFVALTAGVFSQNSSSPGATPGSYQIWTINFNCNPPEVAFVTNIPEAKSFNGITTLNPDNGDILAPDEVEGAIFKINVYSGEYSVVISGDPYMSAPRSGRTITGISATGYYGGKLYFLNSRIGFFGYVPINIDGTRSGPDVLTANLSWTPEKFAISADGTTAYFAGQDSLKGLPLNYQGYGLPSAYNISTSSNLLGSDDVVVGRGAYENYIFATTSGGTLQWSSRNYTGPWNPALVVGVQVPPV